MIGVGNVTKIVTIDIGFSGWLLSVEIIFISGISYAFILILFVLDILIPYAWLIDWLIAA